jgi:hypothetical protein
VREPSLFGRTIGKVPFHMNFYDVYGTLSLNPVASDAMEAICKHVGSKNELESLKRALWAAPSRVDSPGAFPFNEETGRIYDSLWKAAAAENYSKVERFGRWLFKTICPPADDEGMAAYHRTARQNQVQEPPKPPARSEPIRDDGPLPTEDEPAEEWHVSDDGDDREIQIPTGRTGQTESVTRRSTKKSD